MRTLVIWADTIFSAILVFEHRLIEATIFLAAASIILGLRPDRHNT